MASLFWSLAVFFLAASVSGHDSYLGKCPNFKPMDGFDFDRFIGRWYAVEKFDTSSRCLTYDFNENELGEREVLQTSVINPLKKLSVDNKVKYKGDLTFPRSSTPADMIVKFPLSVLGSAEYTLMDTDYDNYAMLCTCQQTKIIFDILTWHRRSCTILQRKPEYNKEYVNQMHELLNNQVGREDPDEDQPDHDFDVIRHDRCDYEDNGKGLHIDVDKILDSTKEEVGSYTYDYVSDWEPETEDLVGKGLVEII